MDLIFKTGLTMSGLGMTVLLFTLFIGVFFHIKSDKYINIAAICGGLLSVSGLTLFVLNLLICLWRI